MTTAVIVPCFDAGATLRETVQSVTAESGVDELVIVDDGSTDPASLALLAEFEAEDVQVIRQSNQGPSAATMAGLRATSSPYVMRLDADDLLEPGAVGRLAAALERANDAAVAWGDVQTFGLTTFRIPAAPSLDPWLLTYTNCIPGAGCLLRRSAVEEVGGWQLRDGWEDWDLWLALLEKGWSGLYVPEVAFRYRRSVEGRHIGSVGESGAYYEELRRRHPAVFASRAANRRASKAPGVVKLAVSLIEAIPGLPRGVRVQLCELVTHLFWNGGLRVTATMLWQAARWRRRSRAA